MKKTVVNVTVPKPNLYPHRLFTNYYEASDEILSIQDVFALMKRAETCLVVGDSGGISLFACSTATLKIAGPMTWIENTSFGYENMSLYMARRTANLPTTRSYFSLGVRRSCRWFMHIAKNNLKTLILK